VLRFKLADVGVHRDSTAVVLEGNLLPAHGGDSFSVEQEIKVRGRRGKRK
jgi:hypothetical protein